MINTVMCQRNVSISLDAFAICLVLLADATSHCPTTGLRLKKSISTVYDCIKIQLASLPKHKQINFAIILLQSS